MILVTRNLSVLNIHNTSDAFKNQNIPSSLMQIPGEAETIPEYVNRQKATILDNIHVMETSRTLGNPLQLTFSTKPFILSRIVT
jgi:hypothetical protein